MGAVLQESQPSLAYTSSDEPKAPLLPRGSWESKVEKHTDPGGGGCVCVKGQQTGPPCVHICMSGHKNSVCGSRTLHALPVLRIGAKNESRCFSARTKQDRGRTGDLSGCPDRDMSAITELYLGLGPQKRQEWKSVGIRMSRNQARVL